MSLQEEIDKIRQEIQTDGYSMSIGEWMSLYQSNEIDINPDFQRFFRWSKHQKSAFIESILLETAFKTTFDILNQTTGDNSFKRYQSEQDKFLGGFLLSVFEVVALGIGYNYENIPPTNEISDLIKTIWSNPIYKKWSRPGVGARRLPHLILLGRGVFSPV